MSVGVHAARTALTQLMTSSPSTFVGLPRDRLQGLAAAAQLPGAQISSLQARAGLLGRLVQSRVLQLDEHGACQVLIVWIF